MVKGTNELHVAALEGLLAVAVQHRSVVQKRYSSQMAWLQGLCGHTDSKGQQHSPSRNSYLLLLPPGWASCRLSSCDAMAC